MEGSAIKGNHVDGCLSRIVPRPTSFIHADGNSGRSTLVMAVPSVLQRRWTQRWPWAFRGSSNSGGRVATINNGFFVSRAYVDFPIDMDLTIGWGIGGRRSITQLFTANSSSTLTAAAGDGKYRAARDVS